MFIKYKYNLVMIPIGGGRPKRRIVRAEFLILGLIIATSLLLVGGIIPFNFQNSPNDTAEYIPDVVVPAGGDSSLQLKPITFKKCSGTVTVDFLLDRTGSMGRITPSGKTKISRLKEAVRQLTDKLSDTSIVGIQSFSSNQTGINNITNDVPVSYYKDVKTLIPTKINALQAQGNTPTHDALAYSYTVLRNAQPLFKDREFSFILVSDGEPVPESQDPRGFNPNPADQIKALKINVFTLAIYDSSQAKNPKLSGLLRSIASKPENYYEAENADHVARLLEQIFTKLCDKPAQ